MIDDKETEEYARYNWKNRYPASQDAKFIAEGLRKGDRWAINEFLKNLWHDAEEEPYSNLSPILLDGIDREGRQIVKTSFFRSCYWNKTVEYYGIIRWLYIDDLFPEEEEEEEEE